MSYWAVSDLSPERLRDFALRIRKQTEGATAAEQAPAPG